MNRQTIKYSFLSTIPVMAGYLVLGIGFGILLHDKGYSFWWAILMSVAIYAGSMQYVGVGLLAGIPAYSSIYDIDGKCKTCFLWGIDG